MPLKKRRVGKKKKRAAKKYDLPVVENPLNSDQTTLYLTQIKNLEETLEK